MLPSAKSALGQKASSSWDAPLAPRSGRAKAVKAKADVEASRQEALRRSAERVARESARKALRFSASASTGDEEHKASEVSTPPGSVVPPPPANGSPAAESDRNARAQQRVKELEADVEELRESVVDMRFAVQGLSRRRI